MFHRRHYVEIARIISTFATQQQRDYVAQRFAVEFDKTQSNFDMPRFLLACGVKPK